ncbi:MAG: AraC family transcriptional regulator [Eubacteriales bacterium]|nr:AraC family transcriptional regulator [Eubacteriales bacterium]
MKEIRSIDYFNCRSNAPILSRPSPDFYELLYVDRGELLLTFRKTPFSLVCGDLWLCRPGQPCALCSVKKPATSLLRISFSCPSPSIVFLSDRISHTESGDRILLAQLLSEVRYLTSVSSGFVPPSLNESDAAPPPGCLQMIQLYLEQLLIGLFRRHGPSRVSSCLQSPLSFSGRKTLSDKLYTGVLQYLHDNLNVPLSINQICRDISISRSQLEKLFHEKHDCGVMDFFTRMKINEAKRRIESCNMTVSQIADTLGYSSVQYFSRQFKKQTKMTPSEYSRLAGKYSRTPSSP